jgi:hypothetical protein
MVAFAGTINGTVPTPCPESQNQSSSISHSKLKEYEAVCIKQILKCSDDSEQHLELLDQMRNISLPVF